MTIEFHTQQAAVSEKLLEYIRTEILKLADLNKEISRAEVLLKEEKTIILSENKMCEIRLTVYGDDLLVLKYSENFRKSVKEVIMELKRLVKQQVVRKNEPPDITTSTVDV